MKKGQPFPERRWKFTQEQVDQFYRLGFIHCTEAETAFTMGMPVNSWHSMKQKMTNLAAIAFAKGWEEGKATIRRLQLEEARNGNTAMLIWLGKQWCGQSEAPQFALTLNTQNNVTVELNPDAMKRELVDLQRKVWAESLRLTERSNGNN